MRTFVLISIFLLLIWSFFIEPNMLTVKTINFNIPNLKGLKVVFIGDFHIKPNQKSRLKYVVKKINENILI